MRVFNSSFHTRLNHTITVHYGLEDRLNCYLSSFARQCFKLRCFEDNMPCFRESLKLKCSDNSFRRQYFMTYSMKSKFVPVLIGMNESPGSAAAYFIFI